MVANGCCTPEQMKRSRVTITVGSSRLKWASASEEWGRGAAAVVVVRLCGQRGPGAQVASF